MATITLNNMPVRTLSGNVSAPAEDQILPQNQAADESAAEFARSARVRARASDLPLRKDASPEHSVPKPPEKDIRKTSGWKLVTAAVFYGIGFIFNSTLSLFITYFLNPLKSVANIKEGATAFLVKNVGRVLKNVSHVKVLDSMRSGVEISFMMIAGTVATLIMTPLVHRHGKMAHKVNQWLGKDQHVLPDEMKPVPEPKTLEDKIEQEIDKRVNIKHGAGDLWKARIISMLLCLGGDWAVNKSSRILEGAGQPSVDTLSWRMGQKLYGVLPEKAVKSWVGFFSRHGASIEKIEANMKDHFQRLKNTEITFGAHGGPVNADRMVISEQTRLITKELGWTLIVAVWVGEFLRLFHKRRLKKERQEAIAELTREGLVPEGYKVVLGEHVTLEPVGKAGAWTKKSEAERSQPQKSENFVNAVDTSRTLGEQPVLG